MRKGAAVFVLCAFLSAPVFAGDLARGRDGGRFAKIVRIVKVILGITTHEDHITPPKP